ncbi:Signal transduction histidine kinase [Sanguibacter gelidistatuariae]|uniref:histidine kinase n=1 Tax=Sanguibacter gelidistatuariae TaxID=1814289 RepID=A0A1G6MLY3_9MICO|nr:histidine kinase [Sanguibacter gelidistatuariae]SDC55996.1 Signal transduction histidine kinase [Sanguibacter gelidistatuariae]
MSRPPTHPAAAPQVPPRHVPPPYQPGTPGPARPWTAGARRSGPVAATVALVAVSLFSSMAALAFEGNAHAMSGVGAVWVTAGMFAAFGVSAMIIVRRRYPVALTVVASAFALLFPADAFAALVGLSCVVATQPRRRAIVATAAVSAVTVVAVTRDFLRPAEFQLFTTKPPGGLAQPLPWWFYAIVAIVALAFTVGIGLFRRTTVNLSHVREQFSHSAQTTADLRSELTRQEERDLIAREVHDTLAHRLALVSLHSGALEMAARDHPELQVFAHEVQSNAHRSLEDLRGLIGVLRDPGSRRSDSPGAPATVTLEDLSELLTASRKAGSQMVATVMINDSASASAPLTHAAYRIVQEALTNIHKHAPSSPIDVDLTASAAAGVRILVSNAMPHGSGPAIPGAGAGIAGIHERTRLLGGRAWIGPRDGRFVVDVWLPWQAVAGPG